MATKRSGHIWNKTKQHKPNKQTNKNLDIKGQNLKAYCLSSRQWDSPQSQGGPVWGLPGKIRPALKPQKPESKEAVCLYYRVYQLKSPAFKEKTWSHRHAVSLPGVFLVAIAPPALSPSIFNLCVDPELPSLLLPHEALNQQKIFLEAQRKWSWLFPCACFPFLLPFPGLYLISPQCENLRRKGWDKGERQTKAKRQRDEEEPRRKLQAQKKEGARPRAWGSLTGCKAWRKCTQCYNITPISSQLLRP